MSAKNAKEDSCEYILADKLQRFLLPEIKEACLKQYLEACIYKHALAFFQWREKYAPRANKTIIEQIFTSRIDHLKRVSTKIENKKKKAMENFTQMAAMAKIAEAREDEENHRSSKTSS